MNLILKYFTIIVLFAGFSCTPDPDVKQIVDQAILFHGGDKYENMEIGFEFRNRKYTAVRHSGNYLYTRSFTDTSGHVVDYLSNNSFYREVDKKKIEIPEKKANAYKNSVNSVIYFSLLPFGLNDEAVYKELLGIKTIKGKLYYQVKVTFSEEGGGEDFQDVFMYWFDKEDFSMDYLAYKFFEDEGGIRFREGKNVRNINGLLFSDYKNYSLKGTAIPLDQAADLFMKDSLQLLSSIELEKVTVK